MDWNEERTAVLKKLWLEGMSASQVARQLGGVSRSAVIGKVHRLGITARETPLRPRASSARSPSRIPVRTRQANAIAPARIPVIRAAPIIVDLEPTSGILGLEIHSCRWPIGNPDQNDFGFCGREKPKRASYCDQHARGAFRRFQSAGEIETWSRQGVPEKRIQQRLG
ncbi:GcrA family cell cycle regulator [Caulobacter sp. ErkDOM-E]|uniref:GcrA family cell cycle regulator n=1 Tax=Caulobacter sp. ErkDOM-E TaxID=3402778 RepID=UPI003AF5AF33